MFPEINLLIDNVSLKKNFPITIWMEVFNKLYLISVPYIITQEGHHDFRDG